MEYRLLWKAWREYELIDFGEGQRLERWGDRLLVRPDSWAIGTKERKVWRPHHQYIPTGAYEGRWEPPLSKPWVMRYETREWALSLEVRPGRYKHLGLFPEQAAHWVWLYNHLRQRVQPLVLNLFAYTGAASIVATLAGAQVVHVDASKSAISWARHNAELNNISTIRWIQEDVRTLVARELRRKRQYDAILLDPPAYGIGTEGRRWVLEKDFFPLLAHLASLLTRDGLLLVNLYSGDLSPATATRLVLETFGQMELEVGELALPTSSQRLLSTGYFIRGKRV